MALAHGSGSRGNTKHQGLAGLVAGLSWDHPLPDSPFPCRRRRCRPSWWWVPRKSSSEPDRGSPAVTELRAVCMRLPCPQGPVGKVRSNKLSGMRDSLPCKQLGLRAQLQGCKMALGLSTLVGQHTKLMTATRRARRGNLQCWPLLATVEHGLTACVEW